MQAVERQSQAYRLLTEIALRTDQDPYSAFVLWQAYRARQAARRPIDFEPVAGVAARDRVTKWSRGLPNETFVSLARLPEGLVVWLLDDERFECRWLQATPEWAAAQIESLVRKCADSASDPSAVETEAKALADALFEPIRPYLRSGRTLVVDADASLARAPFAVLFAAEQAPLVRSAGLVEYFMRSATPALQPSHSSLGLAYAPSLTPAWERLYPPLPDAAQEADEVSRGFGRVVRLQGAALTPTAFSRLFASTEVVHFAGHGSGDSGDGALLLSPEVAGRPFSGLLTSSQMARQDAQRCQIAVLSACSTGAGEENGPVNPESLVRVLLNSGARRVVASQWNVDSASTRRLMASFYRRMNEGSFPAQALADAAAEIRADPRKRHPYYWASFQMFGYR
jgi:CHAT domain-containing protein